MQQCLDGPAELFQTEARGLVPTGLIYGCPQREPKLGQGVPFPEHNYQRGKQFWNVHSESAWQWGNESTPPPRLQGGSKWQLWKLLKEISFKMESGSQKRELSHPTIPCQLQTQTGRDVPLQVNAALLPQLEEEGFSPSPTTAQPMRDCHNSANEKPLHFEFPVKSNGLAFNNLSHASLFLIKELSSALFPGLVYGFAVARKFWAAILCYSCINLFLLGKWLAVLFLRLTHP